MTAAEAVVGTRVRTLRAWSAVPRGTEGVVDADYGSGVMVAWDLPSGTLPADYRRYDGRLSVVTGIMRDGFCKRTELGHLEPVR